MTTALTPVASPAVTTEQIDLIHRTIAQGATPDELQLYLYDCQRQGVHPLDKLLHFTKRGAKYTPVTSIDLMRIRAAETGEYAGSDDAVFAAGSPPSQATVTVWRLVQGTRCPFVATARWIEYYPGDAAGAMWRKMPHTMLGKCSEALALRKGFPRQLAGLYAREELDQAAIDVGSTVASAADIETEIPASAVATLPDGTVLIRRVQRQPHGGKILADLITHAGESLPMFRESHVVLAEACCQAREPVILDIGISQKSQRPYLKGLQRMSTPREPDTTPMLTADEVF